MLLAGAVLLAVLLAGLSSRAMLASARLSCLLYYNAWVRSEIKSVRIYTTASGITHSVQNLTAQVNKIAEYESCQCNARTLITGLLQSAKTRKTSVTDVTVKRLPVTCPLLFSGIKAAFYNTDTDILARILADTSDTRDFLKLFLWQAERGSRPTRRDDPLEDVGVGVVASGLKHVKHRVDIETSKK